MNIEEIMKDIENLEERFIAKDEANKTDADIEADGKKDSDQAKGIESEKEEHSDPVKLINDIIEDLQRLLEFFEDVAAGVPTEGVSVEGVPSEAPLSPGEQFSKNSKVGV